MAEHIFIAEGGYFWKQLPMLAMPCQKDLFGQPLGDSKRTVAQHHGVFFGRRIEGKDYQVLLTLTGTVTVTDDVLGTAEVTQLSSQILLVVPKHIYDYPFKPGAKYIITTLQVTEI